MTELRLLAGDDDADQAWALSTLAFGGDPAAVRGRADAGRVTLGAFEAGRLLAKASLRAYRQWWGGQQVPMGGIAGVAVHPEARGRGLGSAVVRGLLPLLAERGEVVSALFPTVPGVYRSLGWETVGSLDETPVPTVALRAARRGEDAGVTVRRAGPADEAALRALYAAHGRNTAGLLTRSGPSFATGPAGVLDHDVVSLAEDGRGDPLGYVAYNRGRGYGPAAELRVRELVADHRPAAAALLATLGSWDSVAPQTRWRGPTDQLGLLLGTTLPPPDECRPWMLRIIDPPAAIAARGFPAGLELSADLVLAGSRPAEARDRGGEPAGTQHAGPWRLTVRGGRGVLEPLDDPTGLPVLSVGGLALLYAGAADTGLLRRTGLLDAAAPGLDAAFAGPRPRLLDYF